MEGTDTSPGQPRSDRGRGRGVSTPAIVSVTLITLGVLAMALPGLLRDGICGLIECADVTPGIAVGRVSGDDLAVVIPKDAASDLSSLRLFPITETSAQTTAGSWIVYRDDPEAAPTSVALGSQPDGFKTRIELTEKPQKGLWVLDASFGCASTLVRFAPEELQPGFVTAGDAPIPIGDFEDQARTSLRCATDSPAYQRWLFMAGAVSASIGALLGIWVLMRRPVRDDPEWYVPDDTLD